MNYFEKANDLYNAQLYVKAIEMYKKALAVKENEAASLYNSAVCYIKLKKYNDAIVLLMQAVSMKKESKYFFNLGYCYAMINNNKKALINFNTAWALDNSDVECEKAINLIMKKQAK